MKKGEGSCESGTKVVNRKGKENSNQAQENKKAPIVGLQVPNGSVEPSTQGTSNLSIMEVENATCTTPNKSLSDHRKVGRQREDSKGLDGVEGAIILASSCQPVGQVLKKLKKDPLMSLTNEVISVEEMLLEEYDGRDTALGDSRMDGSIVLGQEDLD